MIIILIHFHSLSIYQNQIDSSSSSSTSTTIKINNSKLSQLILDKFNEEELKMNNGYLNFLSM